METYEQEWRFYSYNSGLFEEPYQLVTHMFAPRWATCPLQYVCALDVW